MIAVILFSAAILATAIGFLLWANNLDKRGKAYKADLLNLSRKYSDLRTQKAHLDAREDSVKTKEAKIESEKQALEKEAATMEATAKELNKRLDDGWKEVQEKWDALAERLSDVERREAELANKKADVSTREAILGFMGVPEAQDIIEPVEEPQKVAFGTPEKKRCPRCGKDMEMKTDVCYTSIPPQYKYICPECGYEEVDTCPPTHNLVGTDKKPVKKARKGGKK